jgi:hypothetical protein
MAVREFVDVAGLPWRVWCTRPSSRVALMLGYEEGWLTFESAASLRRLMPVPAGWDDLPDRELERLCADAKPVVRRVRQARDSAARSEAANPAWWTERAAGSDPRRRTRGG